MFLSAVNQLCIGLSKCSDSMLPSAEADLGRDWEHKVTSTPTGFFLNQIFLNGIGFR